MQKLKCEYCGKVKDDFSFFIGASLKPDWTMLEGTGKITCPDCYAKAYAIAQNRIDNFIYQNSTEVNKKSFPNINKEQSK